MNANSFSAWLGRDAVMIFLVAAIFVLAIAYSIVSATTIDSNVSTAGVTASANVSVSSNVYASSTVQATGNGIFYSNLSAGASTNTPTTTFNVTGSGYLTGGLGIGFATTGSGQIHTTGLAVFESRVGVGTTGPSVEFGNVGSGFFTGGLGVGFATTGTGQFHVTGASVFESDATFNGRVVSTNSGVSSFAGTLGVASTTPSTTLGVVGSSFLTGGLGVGFATTGTGQIHATGLGVFESRLGVNGTTSPYKESGISGSLAAGSAATTTLSLESTGASVGGCIELQSSGTSANTRWVRIYVGGNGATTTNTNAVVQASGRGILIIEEGRCQ